MLLIEFRGPPMTQAQREAFLKAIVATGVHLAAAELDPSGAGRVEIDAEEFDKQEVRSLCDWLEHQPNVEDVRVSIGGASA